jgi:hypothetical protein
MKRFGTGFLCITKLQRLWIAARVIIVQDEDDFNGLKLVVLDETILKKKCTIQGTHI